MRTFGVLLTATAAALAAGDTAAQGWACRRVDLPDEAFLIVTKE